MKIIGIVATKNRVELLEKAVCSIFAQTEIVDELYIVSDSTDNNFLREKELLKDKDCILLRDRYTHNYAGNLNTAIDEILLSKNDIEDTYIAFLDDDDYWDKNYISECKKVCLHNDFVVCGLRCDMDGYKYDLSIPKSLVINDFLKGNPGIQGSNTFIKFSTLLKAGCFDEEMSSTTDRDLFTRVMKLNPKYVVVDKYLVYVNSSNKRVRITNSDEIKKDGLAKFYYKHSSYMTEEDKQMFFNRALERFGLDSDELYERIKTIDLNKKNDLISFEKYNFLDPKLMSCNNDFKYFVNTFINSDKYSDDYKETIDKCLEFFGYKGKEKHLKEIALLSLEPLVKNLSISRVQLYEKYLEIIKYLYVKNIRKLYINYDLNEIGLNIMDDELDIKAIFDYARHKITSKDTFNEFKSKENNIKAIINFDSYKPLGYGSEGFVFTCDGYIYKWFKKWDSNLLSHLTFLKSKVKKCRSIYDFEILNEKGLLFIKYPYREAHNLVDVNKEQMINLIEDFRQAGLCLTNIKRRNFVVDNEGIKYIDYGLSITEFNTEDYQRSIVRANQLVDNFDKSDLEFYKLIHESYLLGGK